MPETSRNYFYWNRPAYEQAFQAEVCAKCRHHGAHGCNNPESEACFYRSSLGHLTILAQHVPDTDFDRYLAEVDQKVLAHCRDTANENLENLKTERTERLSRIFHLAHAVGDQLEKSKA